VKSFLFLLIVKSNFRVHCFPLTLVVVIFIFFIASLDLVEVSSGNDLARDRCKIRFLLGLLRIVVIKLGALLLFFFRSCLQSLITASKTRLLFLKTLCCIIVIKFV
jgi:hypothetical protein